ncbi:MAG: hypothetical protein ACOCXH_09440 [Cyclobacteriaceae bacterium]
MKKTEAKIAILIFFTSINIAYAQFDVNNTLYSTSALNIGNYIGIDADLNYIFNEKYSIEIGDTGNIRVPRSKPEDYTSGVVGILLFGLINPYDQLQNFQIGIGKLYNLNPNGTIRANVSIGIGYTIITEPENWESVNNGFLGENYTWNYNEHHTVSFTINPKIEFPITWLYGFVISPMIQISQQRIYFGIGLGQMIGLLRR